ncbi:MAG: zinc ribbon domain-containing protein [Acidobacteriota bacterium]
MAKATKKAPSGQRFTPLEKNILISKGLTEKGIGRLAEKGVRGKKELKLVGDAGTLAELAGVRPEVAQRVMSWALGGVAISARGEIVVQAGDVVLCIHCNAKQPKDYKSGDLCGACGKQAEPIMACFWCGATGPGRFCRQCGAEFVPTPDLELGILLKREGVPKSDIPEKLRRMSQTEKDALWGRARRY